MLASYLGSEIIPIATMCSWIFILLVLIESALGGDSNSTHVSDVNFVVPMSVNCEHNQTCLSMHLYVEDKDKFFKDGAVFIFLAGNHSLQKQLNLTGISRITLRSQENSSSVNIICSNIVTFRCENVTDFNVTGLTFLLQSNEHQIASALAFFSSAKIIISNLIFQGRCNAGNTSAWAVFSYNSSITIVNSLFEGNTGSKGGALSVQRGSTLVSIHNNFTRNRGSISSGALHVSRSTTLLEDSVFSHNSGEVGGAIYCLFCTLTIRGNARFVSNYCTATGGAVMISKGNISIAGVTTFINNSCSTMGGAVRIVNGKFTVMGETFFLRNKAREGGAMHLHHSKASFNGACITFEQNEATKGGAINTAYSLVSFKSTVTFINNTASTGGAIYALQGKLQFEVNSTFTKNTAKIAGAFYTFQAVIYFEESTKFTNNTARKNGGALYMVGGRVILKDTVSFSLNLAANGGAIYVTTVTTLSLASGTDLITSQNKALEYGGVIYHKDSTVTPMQCSYFNSSTTFDHLPFCFLELLTWEPTIFIYLYDNSASKGGSFMYGGLLDKCNLERSFYSSYHKPNTFMNIMNVTSSNGNGVIGSDPFQLSHCDSTQTHHNSQGMSVTVHRGETFTIKLVARSQGGLVTSTSVTAVVSNSSRLELAQTVQHLPGRCSGLAYTLYSTMDFEQLVLYPDGPCRDAGLARVVVNVTLQICPDVFSQQGAECVCEERLQEYDVKCILGDKMYVLRKADSTFWMSTLYRNGSYQGLILYHSCPEEYCIVGNVTISLDNLDAQCDLNRSGVLCGACASNYSLLLGSSRCTICSNIYLSLLLPFAAAGIVLVALLTFLKLTVATGMINSLILYANIIQVNRKLFFPSNSVNILTVFIAWMNLDLGFETCFYAGMDAHAQTWLQFVFPVYIWALIGSIIIGSRYSITLSKIIGSNPIAVLATVLLMSYTKILKIIIEVFSSGNLEYPNGEKISVWLKDANLAHLQSKHLILTVVTSLVLTFIFLPYTLLLLLSFRLYHIQNRRYIFWLNRLKPLLDSYYAPYKIHTRYWTGFLLLIRCTLYVVFSMADTRKRFLAIIVTFTGIAIAASGRLYRNIYVDLLEDSIYFNIIILSAGTLAGANKAAMSYTLVGTVFATTMGVILYHFHLLYMAKSAMWKKVKSKLLPSRTTPRRNDVLQSNELSSTATKLREPLLEN